MLASFKGSFKKFNTKSRIGLCALSAGWTGSCQSDEKKVLAVHRPHPAAMEDRIISCCSKRSAKEVIFYEKIGNFVPGFLQ